MSFFSFQCIKHDWLKFLVMHYIPSSFFTWFRITFLSFLKFPEIERENLISWGWGKGGTYSPEQLSYLVLPSVFQFLKFKELKIFIIYYISKSFTWFRITFLSFLEFPLIDEEGRPSFLGETNPAEWLNYLSPSPPPPPFCIWILNIQRTKILCHLLYFNVFYMIQRYLSQFQFSRFSPNWRGGT